MNERIKELDNAAQEYAGKVVGNDEDSNQVEWFNVYKEKFAELIVQECILVIEENAEHTHAEGTIEAIVNLEMNFGVD